MYTSDQFIVYTTIASVKCTPASIMFILGIKILAVAMILSIENLRCNICINLSLAYIFSEMVENCKMSIVTVQNWSSRVQVHIDF